MDTKEGVPSVRPMQAADAATVLAIYQSGLDTGQASFESTAPDWATFDAGRLPDHRLVAVVGDALVGWVAVSPVSSRPVYAGVVEHSVYIAPDTRGQGIGRLLLGALIASTDATLQPASRAARWRSPARSLADAAAIWTIQSGVFPENAASLALHRSAGFRTVGTRERIGRHHGVWRDVVLLERRSSVVV
jgi:phosphinothricin acetyltransferase